MRQGTSVYIKKLNKKRWELASNKYGIVHQGNLTDGYIHDLNECFTTIMILIIMYEHNNIYYVTNDANSFEAISYTTNVIADAGAAFIKEGYKPLYNPAAPSI